MGVFPSGASFFAGSVGASQPSVRAWRGTRGGKKRFLLITIDLLRIFAVLHPLPRYRNDVADEACRARPSPRELTPIHPSQCPAPLHLVQYCRLLSSFFPQTLRPIGTRRQSDCITCRCAACVLPPASRRHIPLASMVGLSDRREIDRGDRVSSHRSDSAMSRTYAPGETCCMRPAPRTRRTSCVCPRRIHQSMFTQSSPTVLQCTLVKDSSSCGTTCTRRRSECAILRNLLRDRPASSETCLASADSAEHQLLLDCLNMCTKGLVRNRL